MKQQIIQTFDELFQIIADLREEVKGLKASIEALQPQKSGAVSSDQTSCTLTHKLCKIDRACEITRKAKSTLYAIARRGDMPCIKNGKNWYFYEDELMDWLEQGRQSHCSPNNEQMLSQIQANIHHKPKSLLKGRR